MKKILIIGAKGAIGSELTKKLSSDYKIYPINNRFKYDEYEKKILSIKPEYIINAAGVVSNQLDACLSENFYLTETILRIVYKNNLNTRILAIGSAAEYGQVKNSNKGIKETNKLNPINNYGLSKCMQTLLIKKYSNEGLDIVTARVFNIDSTKVNSNLFIGSLIKQIKDYKNNKIRKIKIGNLTAKRDYIQLDKASDKIINILLYGNKGEIYNVGSGKLTSMRTILKKYLKIYNVDIKNIEYVKHRSTGVLKIYSDNTKYDKLIKK